MNSIPTRRRPVLTVTALAGAALVLSACSGDAEADADGAAVEDLTIIVPADPGGGWDQTGRAFDEVATTGDFVASASVENVPGAGGLTGLDRLVADPDADTLMVTGLVMVGAVETNGSDTRIEDTTPVARLTEEPLVVVVPADSEYETLEDLVEAIVAEGQGVPVTGGSAGGADHILAGLLLGEAGLSAEETPQALNYIANSGGGEAVTLLLGGNVSAGISGVGEFEQYVTSGDLRALAVSGEDRSKKLPDVPTITEAGYDVVLTNWRGLLAAGDLTEEEKTALVEVATEVAESEEWQALLAERGWDDAFLAGAEFEAFLDGNIAEVTETLTSIGLVE